jgi:pyruvate ferredoxin oxidoreductase gamma subunit
MKTASRLLGSAFFLQGYEVQDAPRYGAERRGAPIFAYVRAARQTIQERGIILEPDLVIVADDSLLPMPAAGVLQGITPRTVLLIHSREAPETWRQRLNIAGPLLTLPVQAEQHFAGTALTGAAARLVGVITAATMEQAIRQELAGLGEEKLSASLEQALAAYDGMAAHAGLVSEGQALAAAASKPPDWIELPLDEADAAAAAIHAGATSVEVRTGLWRTLRPVIDYARCKRCWWVCSEFCPDSAIKVNAENYPEIDYEHCKGCLICVAQCPSHAITPIPESSEVQP